MDKKMILKAFDLAICGEEGAMAILDAHESVLGYRDGETITAKQNLIKNLQDARAAFEQEVEMWERVRIRACSLLQAALSNLNQQGVVARWDGAFAVLVEIEDGDDMSRMSDQASSCNLSISMTDWSDVPRNNIYRLQSRLLI